MTSSNSCSFFNIEHVWTCSVGVLVIALKMYKVKLWNRELIASILTHQKFIFIRVVVHISYSGKGVL